MEKFEVRLKKGEREGSQSPAEASDKIAWPELYTFVVENSHIGFLVIDNNYHVVYANAALERMTGYSLTEVAGSDFRDFLVDESRELVTERYLNRQKGNNVLQTYEAAIYRKDGQHLTVEINVAVTKTAAGQVLTLVQVFDVSARKQIESELAESRRKYQDLFYNVKEIIEGSPIPVLVINRDHVLTHWNEACERLTGIRAEALVGTALYWKAFYPEKRPLLVDLVLDKAPKHKFYRYYGNKYRMSGTVSGAYEAEAFFPHLAEKGRWLFFTAAPLRDAMGKLTGAMETLIDITDKKRAEKNLLKMHDALEEKVKERTQALEEANVAMQVLLKKREADRIDLGEQMVVNIREIISPYIERLKQTSSKDMQNVLIEIIEQNLEDIASPFMRDLSKTLHKLTPSEIQIINLIKHNKTTKEISDLLNISARTVDTHRANIRKKLGIRNQKINLKSFLLSIGQTGKLI